MTKALSPSRLFPWNKVLLFLFAGFLLTVSLAHAKTFSKDEILKKYEKAVYLSEELNVYQEDVLQVTPKVKLAMSALLRNDFAQADRVLDEALDDLSWIQTQRPNKSQKAFQLQWLEIYRDTVQKFAALALFAFVFIRIPYFKKQLLANRLTAMARVYLVLLTGISAVFFSFFDLFHYGESTWAFMDVQIILTAAGGLIGGMIPGLFLGLLAATFRLILAPKYFVYALIAASSGILGGLFSYRIKDYKNIKTAGLMAGLAAGILHGLTIYLPALSVIKGSYTLLSVAFVALLETAGMLLICAIISTQLRNESRGEMEKELLKTKLQFLQTQINPHFLYNALNTISAICGEEGAQKAKSLILHLADFFRGTLKHVEDTVTLKEEMAHIDAYLAIEKARFQERLQIEKKMEISETAWKVKMPFLTLQPLVENAIKHGISKKTEGGKVEIRAYEKAGNLVLEVKDNGAGMQPPILEAIMKGQSVSQEGGIGIQNVNQRLSNSKLKSALSYQSEPGKGTTVTFEIPVKK